ncbi:hypothetical protein BGX38DRAFT_1278692 [Terfezia claveryi]|nr:hypothetical protein BGX38DRAFT_1278692 [Terfezia claveryi]
MSLPLSPSGPPIEVNSNPNLTFRFPANRSPPTTPNDQPVPSLIGQTPYVGTRSDLSQQLDEDSRAASTPSLYYSTSETDNSSVKSPMCAAGTSPYGARASENAVEEVQFQFPGSLPVEESNDPDLRDLYLKGQTYTLALVMEEVLSGISLFCGKANKYQHCIKRMYALDKTSAPAGSKQTSEWDCSGSQSHEHRASRVEGVSETAKAKQKGKLENHAEKWLAEMEEEGEKLLVSLRSLLQPLEESALMLRKSIERLPSLSDTIFWAQDYDEKLKTALEWDMVVQLTASDHLLPQYLPSYNSLSQLLTREFPSATALEESIPGEGSRKVMGNLVKTIFKTAVEISFQANEASLLTRHLTSKLQNCLMSLQWQTKQFLGVMDNPIYKSLRQEAEEDEKPEQERNHPFHTTHEKRIVIIGTLSHIILTLRQLRLSEGKHIITLPTSYLHIPANTKTRTFHQEEKQILAYLTDLKSSTNFLKSYLKLHLDIVDPKYLLPFFLEMGAYTRGTMLTQADKLLSGWVVWREMCLTVGGWEAMEMRVNARDHNIDNYALFGMRPGEDLSRANSIVSTSTTQSTCDIDTSTAKGKGPAEASESPKSFKHKFSFPLIPIPPAEELAPKGSLPKDSLPICDPIPQLTHQATQRLLGNENSNYSPTNTEFSLATPIMGLNHLAGPPQRIWPAAALAVQSKGVVTLSNQQTVVYTPKVDWPPKVLLDENFSLEDVLRFYAAAMEEQNLTPFSVPGSSVARAYWKLKQLDEDRKLNEELFDACLSATAEPTRLSPRGTAKFQWTLLMKRSKRMICGMKKMLSQFFGKSNSTEASSATPIKSCKNPTSNSCTSTSSDTAATKTSSEGAIPLPYYTPPSYTPPSLSLLNSEQISSITTCFNLRKDYRDTLRLLSEMKTEAKCLFDGERYTREYLNAIHMGMPLGPELVVPKEFLDRECAWRKLAKDTIGGTINGIAEGAADAGKGKKRMELD